MEVELVNNVCQCIGQNGPVRTCVPGFAIAPNLLLSKVLACLKSTSRVHMNNVVMVSEKDGEVCSPLLDGQSLAAMPEHTWPL